MSCPGVGPCTVWDLDLSPCIVTGGTPYPSGGTPNPCLTDGTPVSQEIIDFVSLAGSQMLWALTGRQFGTCTVDLRPCRRKCQDACCSFSADSYPWLPMKQANGTWTNVSCLCEDDCFCSGGKLCEVALPYPVCSIEEVLIDGEEVDPTTYRVDEFYYLVRLGEDCWPTCNDLTKPATEVGTWQITVTYGRVVPELVLRAAAEFASELVKDCVGKPCALPSNITAVTRQGITEVFTDPRQSIIQGYTGLYLTDLAILTYNPKKLARRAGVYSPDKDSHYRRTTWQGT